MRSTASISATPSIRPWLLGVVAGLAWLVALPPVGLWPFGIFACAALVRASREQAAWSSAITGVVAGLVVYGVSLRWSLAFSGLGYVMLVVIEAGFLAAAMGLTPKGRGAVLAIPAAITLSEWLRHRWPLSGLPLSGLDLTQASGPLLPLAAVGGPLLLTLLAAALGSLVVLAVRTRPLSEIAVAGLVVVASMTVASALLMTTPGDSVGQIDVAIVQGGGQRGVPAVISNDDRVFGRHLAVSRRIETPVDLVLWPEDVVDVDRLEGTSELVALAGLAAQLEAVVVVGTITDARDGPPGGTASTSVRRFRNRAQVIGPDGSTGDAYDKVIRVPFGEYVPWRAVIDRIVDLSLIPREAVPGSGPGTLESEVGRLGVAISFEGLYASRARSAVLDGAVLLLNPTNSSSFATSDVPAQQLAAARLRAVETGRVVLMASPTGRSAIVMPDGRVQIQSGLGEPALLTAQVPLLGAITPFTRWGDAPVLAVSLALFAAGWIVRFRDRDALDSGSGSSPSGARSPVRARVAALTALAMAAVSCAGPSQTSQPASSSLLEVAVGLCTAAEAPDVTSAINSFGEVHLPLHGLADETAQVDRAVAGRLLRAKQQVEAEIDGAPDAARLRPLLEELAAATAAALRTLDLSPPALCSAFEQSS